VINQQKEVRCPACGFVGSAQYQEPDELSGRMRTKIVLICPCGSKLALTLPEEAGDTFTIVWPSRQ
jgi:hypothetical protein